jgi:hypothetical protein
MVMEELNLLPEIRAAGQSSFMSRYEPLGIPYPTNEYHVRSKADSDRTFS